MTARHTLSALLVALVWGFNFVAMKTAFIEIPPFLFLFIRLAVTVFPLILFLPRPKISFYLLFWISIFQWTLHFALLFSGMYLGLSGGITSLLIQSQVLFTILLTCVYFKSKPTTIQVIGLTVSFSGLILLTTQGDCSANWMGILLILGAAVAVSISNILYREAPKDVNMPSLIVWSSALAIPQALILTFLLEGWEVIQDSLMIISLDSIIAIIYTVFVSTMIGIVTWCKLMQRSDPIKIVPFMLLVPIIAMSSGYLMMDEMIGWFDLGASAIIISGLLINQLSSLKRAKVVKLETVEDVPLKKAA